MGSVWRHISLGAFAALAACSPEGRHPVTPSPAPVVVAIVIDQFSAWVAEERVPELPPDGFFARMRREGVWHKRMRYPYALTDTAPGHASLHTGRVPADSHVLVNHNPDDKTGMRSSFFRDPTTKVVTPRGPTADVGSSARLLAVPTVADRLREQHPKARVLSVSLKDRASLLPAGKRPSHALWFDPKEDSFVTSTAIEPTFPSWAAPLGDRAAVARARAQPWTPLDPAWVAAHASSADDAPGEGNIDDLGTTFPHTAKTPWAFRATPFSDRMILDLALAGVKAERDRYEPFLLLVSLSASDVIGHTFGPSSWEAWDHLRRLDRELARFLVELEEIAGTVSVLVSGDHGNVAMPEAHPGCKEGQDRLFAGDPYDRPCGGGGRILPDVLRAELREEVEKELGVTDAIAGVSDGYVFLTAAARGYDVSKRAKVDEIVRRVLRTRHGRDVAEVFDARDLATKCPGERAKTTDDLLALVCRSWAPNAGAGDYYVVPAHGSFFDGEVSPGKGTSHGTPYLYDRTVPLFVRASGIEGGVTSTEPIDFTAYAKYEAELLGLRLR